MAPRSPGTPPSISLEDQKLALASSDYFVVSADRRLGVVTGGMKTDAPLALRQRPDAIAWLAHTALQADVRVGALLALAQIANAGPQSVPFSPSWKPLFLARMTDPSPAVASAAMEGSATVLRGDADIQALQREACRRHAHATIRASACQVMLRHRANDDDSATIEAALRALDDTDPVVAIRTLDGVRIARFFHDRLYDGALVHLTKGQDIVRGDAVVTVLHFALNKPALKEKTVGALSTLAGDKSAYVRAQTVVALLALDDRPETLNSAVKLLGDRTTTEITIPFRALSLTAEEESRWTECLHVDASCSSVGDALLRPLAERASKGNPPFVVPTNEDSEVLRTALERWLGKRP